MAERFGMPAAELTVLVRHEPIMSGDVRIEYFNFDHKKYGLDKKLSQLNTKLKHGSLVFVEAAPVDKKFEQLRWHKAIKNEKSLLVLHINLTEVMAGADHSTQLRMSKEKTMQDLKVAIGKEISMDPTGFTVKRQHVGSTMNYPTRTLAALGLTSGALLKVELGQTEGDGFYVIHVAFARLLQEEDRPDATDEVLFKTENLGKLEVDGLITVSDFRDRVYNELIAGKDNSAAKAIKSAGQMRIRDPKNEDLGGVLSLMTKATQESLTLGDGCHLFGGKELLVQAHHDTLIPKFNSEPGLYNLLVREWDPETWAFGTLYEV